MISRIGNDAYFFLASTFVCSSCIGYVKQVGVRIPQSLRYFLNKLAFKRSAARTTGLSRAAMEYQFQPCANDHGRFSNLGILERSLDH